MRRRSRARGCETPRQREQVSLFMRRKVVRPIMMACGPSIDTLAAPGIVVGKRLISDGDEGALLPEEADAFARSVMKTRRASGAARIVARKLLGQLGCSN